MGKGTSKAGGNSAPAEKAPFKYVPTVKPLSPAEEKRTQDMHEKLRDWLFAGDDGEFMEYYDYGDSKEVYKGDVAGEEVIIYKTHLVYADNRDENGKRVKEGKAVTGSTHYTVSVNGNDLDENIYGYKTFDDAKHALDLYADYTTQREAWRNS